MSKLFIRAAGALLIAGVSTVAWAGGHGGHGPMVMHSGGFHGGGHWGGGGFHAVPPVAGTIHVRPNGGNVFSGYGHTGTAFRGRAGFGGSGWQPGAGTARRSGPSRYGHTNTAFGGRPGFYRRDLFERRWGDADRFAFGHRSLRYGRVARNLRDRYRVVGGYGGYDLSAAPTYGGYAEAPLASYVEAPLDQVYGAGGYGAGGYGDGGYAPSSGYAGGPQIIVVNNNYAGASHRGHGCDPRPSPVVYRFGVGSYY